LVSHFHESLYTLRVDVDRRRRGIDKGREGGIAIERGFPLLEIPKEL